MKLTTLKPRIPSMGARLTQYQVLEVKRLRGRAAVTRRARWLQEHPLCVECDKEGRTSAATAVDHTIPLWKGGPDDYETNGQSLCKDHHDTKSAQEARERAALGGSARY